MTPLGADLLILSGIDLAFGAQEIAGLSLRAEGQFHTSMGRSPMNSIQRHQQGCKPGPYFG